MFRIADGLARYMAPLLVYTGDEIYESLHKAEPGTVHERVFPEPVPQDLAVLATWKPLLEARDAALKSMETARAAKTIASSLEATLVVRGSAEALAPLRAHDALQAPYPGNLASLFIVSGVSLEETLDPELSFEVLRASGVKCTRCWTYSTSSSTPGGEDTRAVCPRCASVVAAGETR